MVDIIDADIMDIGLGENSDIGDSAGGKMAIPLMAVAVGAGSLVSAMTAMANYRATKSAVDYVRMYQNSAYAENSRFWNDYRKAHGWNEKRKIRYPYRTGYYYNLSTLQNAGVREVSSKNGVYRALAGGIVPFGFFKRSGYSARMNYPSVMYG